MFLAKATPSTDRGPGAMHRIWPDWRAGDCAARSCAIPAGASQSAHHAPHLNGVALPDRQRGRPASSGWMWPLKRPAPWRLCWWTASRELGRRRPKSSSARSEPTWGASHGRASVRLGRGGAGVITRVRASSAQDAQGQFGVLRRALVEANFGRRSSARGHTCKHSIVVYVLAVGPIGRRWR